LLTFAARFVFSACLQNPDKTPAEITQLLKYNFRHLHDEERDKYVALADQHNESLENSENGNDENDVSSDSLSGKPKLKKRRTATTAKASKSKSKIQMSDDDEDDDHDEDDDDRIVTPKPIRQSKKPRFKDSSSASDSDTSGAEDIITAELAKKFKLHQDLRNHEPGTTVSHLDKNRFDDEDNEDEEDEIPLQRRTPKPKRTTRTRVQSYADVDDDDDDGEEAISEPLKKLYHQQQQHEFKYESDEFGSSQLTPRISTGSSRKSYQLFDIPEGPEMDAEISRPRKSTQSGKTAERSNLERSDTNTTFIDSEPSAKHFKETSISMSSIPPHAQRPPLPPSHPPSASTSASAPSTTTSIKGLSSYASSKSLITPSTPSCSRSSSSSSSSLMMPNVKSKTRIPMPWDDDFDFDVLPPPKSASASTSVAATATTATTTTTSITTGPMTTTAKKPTRYISHDDFLDDLLGIPPSPPPPPARSQPPAERPQPLQAAYKDTEASPEIKKEVNSQEIHVPKPLAKKKSGGGGVVGRSLLVQSDSE
jgi:hypothetical protein